MSLRLRIYVTAVIAAGALVMWLGFPHDPGAHWGHYVGWTVIALVSESLWLPALSGEGTVSMASTAGLATVLLWGPAPAIWIAAVSTVFGDLLVQRKPWVRALFNAAQIAVTTWLAGAGFVAAGGPADGLVSVTPMPSGDAAALWLAVPTLVLFVIYHLVNRALVAVAVAWSSDRPYRQVLREDWFYTERLLQDAAAFLLAPLMVLSYLTVGYVGVAVFYSPLRIFNESARRYIELKGAQNQLIHSERMAAKGEMAAEVGHELRNQLAAISGRAQMLIKEAEREVHANVGRHAQIILEQTRRMEGLSKGLMDFSRAELQIEPVDLGGLIQRSVEFVRAQNRFDGVEWDLRIEAQTPELRADPGQLQQVLLNLFLNAADAMNDANVARKAITVHTETDPRAGVVRLEVRDSGPGIAAANLSRIFEPHFTTKPQGHGFGLSTSYRIIENHHGRITAESPPGGGALFTVSLPLPGSGWRAG